jgi:hypothetical protein
MGIHAYAMGGERIRREPQREGKEDASTKEPRKGSKEGTDGRGAWNLNEGFEGMNRRKESKEGSKGKN